MKRKENEKIDKCFNLSREQKRKKKLKKWSMKVTVIPMVVGAYRKYTK